MNWTQEDKLYMCGRSGHEAWSQELDEEEVENNANVFVLMYEIFKLKTSQLAVLKSIWALRESKLLEKNLESHLFVVVVVNP